MRAVDPRVSFAELGRWPDDGRQYELYGGEAIVVPAPSGRHQQVVIALVNLLSDHRRACGGLVLCSPIDIVLSEYDVLQPDVVWFSAERRRLVDLDSAIRVVPDLAIEVLSRKTEARDRGRKMELLGRFGLPEYWLVDPVRRTLEIHTNVSSRLILSRTLHDSDDVASPTVVALHFPVERLFEDSSTR